MKKTSFVIVYVLLFALFLSGCTQVKDITDSLYEVFENFVTEEETVDKNDFSRYGFTFKIDGEINVVSPEQENSQGYCEFSTIYGTLYVTKMERKVAETHERALVDLGFEKEILENSGRFYKKEVEADRPNIDKLINTEYCVDDGDYIWKMFFMTPDDCYDETKILEVYRSFQIVHPA